MLKEDHVDAKPSHSENFTMSCCQQASCYSRLYPLVGLSEILLRCSGGVAYARFLCT